jgi:hypothetical protein
MLLENQIEFKYRSLFYRTSDIPSNPIITLPGTVDLQMEEKVIGDFDYILDVFLTGTSGSPYLNEAFKRYNFPDIKRTSIKTLLDDIAELEFAMENDNSFTKAIEAIDWNNRSAESFVRAIQLALSIGSHQNAYKLIRIGIQKYPSNKELIMIARILLPSKAEAIYHDIDSSINNNKIWFDLHSREYRGKWVAIENGNLLGSANSFVTLQKIVPNWREATVTKIAW